MSSSIMKTLQIRKPAYSLPVSSTTDASEPGLIRRRLSSLSLNLSRNQASTAGDGDFPRSKSVSAMGEQGGSSVKEWWEWSWSLILLKKLPIFFTDLEFNKNKTKSSSLGKQQRGSFAQVFFRLRSEIRRLLRTSSSDSLPLSCKQ